MIYRLILPAWAKEEFPTRKVVLEGEFSLEYVQKQNSQNFYNAYWFSNYPSIYEKGTTVEGSQVDKFEWCFVDMDLKEGKYADKDAFIARIAEVCSVTPTRIIDSGNGVHAYFKVVDLDAMSFLKLQRRLCRLLDTDDAVGKLCQLMRVPDTLNTKDPENLKLCELIFDNDRSYTCEDLDKALPPISNEDEEYCKRHFAQTYKVDADVKIDEKLPLKFLKMVQKNKEVNTIWRGDAPDRSRADFHLGHILFTDGFTKQEALTVLANSPKARHRAPVHRISYASNIVDKIWTFELEADNSLTLSSTVKSVLQRCGDAIKGTRLPCWSYIDATQHGFRLGQVIGLVAGSGVGKTTVALNLFRGFVQSNPDYEHFFIPLEQPVNEIADHWKTMCEGNEALYEKVHLIDNYDPDGSYRNLSFDDIKEYIIKFQKVTGKKIGCVVIDHIGALKKKGKDGENQDLMDICHQMKAFAISTNTLLVMQSQAPREKAGSGDLELNKDAAYGTVYFESYCDYLITLWQPLKKCHSEEGCLYVTAFKFCKIRHKKANLDNIQEDVTYLLKFNPTNEHLNELTQKDEKVFDFFNKKCTNKRKLDRKTDVMPYKSISWTTEEEVANGTTENSQDLSTTEGVGGLPN